jgi:hypothetical protein
VHAKCSGLRSASQYHQTKDWTCNTCRTTIPPLLSPPAQQTPANTDSTFNILQFNANGIGNKLTELGLILEKNDVKIAVIQESKLSARNKDPHIPNYSTVRLDREQGSGGGLLTFVHTSVTFSHPTPSAESKADPHLEELAIKIKLDDTELTVVNCYIPPSSSCSKGYQANLDHLLTTSDKVILGDFNAHHSSWHSGSDDMRGRLIADQISSSNYGILNWDTPTRVPTNGSPSSPDISLASDSLITSSTWKTLTTLSSDHLPILISLQTTTTVNKSPHRTYVNLKKANWEHYTQEIEKNLNGIALPTNCQKDEKILRAIILKAASHHIPSGRHKLNKRPVPKEIQNKMEERDSIRSRDPTSPRLKELNKEINKAIDKHRQQQWQEFVETLDHRTNSSRLWKTIKAIDGKSKPQAENEALVFNNSAFTSPKAIATKFNKQFTTSKLGIHKSSQETRRVTREVHRKPLNSETDFSTDQVTKAIKMCNNSKAFGPDKLTIFHLKHLGPLAIEYLSALFNDSITSCRIPAIWKMSIIIPIPKPGKDSSQGTSYRPISLICPAAKVLEALVLPIVNTHLHPAPDQHGFCSARSTSSALLQLTTDIANGFNKRKPPDRTVCVAIDLTAAFDTVSHNDLITKIARSTLPPGIIRWLSCYLRGRQAVTSFRGATSPARIVHAGVPQGSKLSPALFNFYVADMPKPVEPVRRVCYADDITVWASGEQIPELETSINDYMLEMSTYLTSNSLIVSAPKSTVTLFTPDPAQAKTHPKITVAGSVLPLVRNPKVLGVYLDTSLTFNKHCDYVAARVKKRNNVLKALAGTTWGQQKETLLMTFKAIGGSIINYAAPVWSTNASRTSLTKIQVAQNEAIRISTGSHRMASIDHLHRESKMLKTTEHLDLLSAQYLTSCLNPRSVSHNITTTGKPQRQMKQTLLTRHLADVEPLITEGDHKRTLQSVHTAAVAKSMAVASNNRILGEKPPPISITETALSRLQRSTLSQLRSGFCRLTNYYKNRLDNTTSDSCDDCGVSPHDVHHLFNCTAHPTALTPIDLWRRPAEIIHDFTYLLERD